MARGRHLDRHLKTALKNLRLSKVPSGFLDRLDTVIRKTQALCEDIPEASPRRRRVKIVQTEFPFE